MTDKFVPPQDFMDNYKKRQKLVPLLFIALAVLLVIIGILVILLAGKGQGGWIATKTSTATNTLPPTATIPSPLPTMTATETQTPLPTVTSTPSGPFEYVVQSGDNCYDIATKYGVDLVTLLAINNFTTGGCSIQPGQTIIIPAPGQKAPTPTNIPSDMPRGTKLNILCKKGIHWKPLQANSILQLKHCKFEQVNHYRSNTVNVGDVLTISVNLVTPTPTRAPTSTKAATAVPPSPTATK